VRRSLMVLVLACMVVGCSQRPTSEDGRRDDLLAKDPMLTLAVPSIRFGQVYARPGNGDGPATDSSTAERLGSTQGDLKAAARALLDHAVATGWTITFIDCSRPIFVQGTKLVHGFLASLIISVGAAGPSPNATVRLSTDHVDHPTPDQTLGPEERSTNVAGSCLDTPR
jgi:hypothetical protein